MVRGYVGHGIGTAMHEPPDVPNQGRRGRGEAVAAGDVYAVEPMVSAGSGRTAVLDDGWTVVTLDGAPPPTGSTPWPSPTTAPRS